MSPFSVVCLVLGVALIAAGFGLALKYRREGGVEVHSRKFYTVVLLAGLGAGFLAPPLVTLVIGPTLGWDA